MERGGLAFLSSHPFVLRSYMESHNLFSRSCPTRWLDQVFCTLSSVGRDERTAADPFRLRGQHLGWACYYAIGLDHNAFYPGNSLDGNNGEHRLDDLS